MKKLFVRLLLVLAGLASDSVNVAWQRPCLSHGHFADRRLRGRQSSFGHGAAEPKDPLGGRRSGVDRRAQTDKGGAQGVELREEAQLTETWS